MPNSLNSRRFPRRLVWISAAGLILILTTNFLRPQVTSWLRTRTLLSSDVVDVDAVAELLQISRDPDSVSETFWRSTALSHRRAVVELLTRPGATDSTRSRTILEAAAFDPDLGIRERALGALQFSNPATAAACVAPQLGDPDPEVRRLGIQTVRRVGDIAWTPALLPLLRDPDPSIILAADSLFRRWSRVDSGLRLTNALPGYHGIVEAEIPTEVRDQLAAAPAFWEAWWSRSQAPGTLVLPRDPVATPRSRVADFELPDIDGRPRRLSEFAGRVILLNFWATWCTPCLVEMPALVELQNRHGESLAVVGICLDNFREGPLAGSPDAPARPEDEPAALRRIVRPFVARHRLNYPVLMDTQGQVSRRFEGNELPTQVLLDRNGALVRRFVGGRSASAWASLIGWAESTNSM